MTLTSSCEFCIVNHYLDAYSGIPPALRADPTKPDSDSSRNATESIEVMCMFDARDEERASKCKDTIGAAQEQVQFKSSTITGVNHKILVLPALRRADGKGGEEFQLHEHPALHERVSVLRKVNFSSF